MYVTADDTSSVISDDLLRRNESAKLLLCDWLGSNRLIITRAVRHLAITTFAVVGGNAFRAV